MIMLKSYINTLVAGIVLATATGIPVIEANAGGKVPCEPWVPKIEKAFAASKATAADQAKARQLEKSGLEKCKTEKDAAAVEDFKAAFKLLGITP